MTRPSTTVTVMPLDLRSTWNCVPTARTQVRPLLTIKGRAASFRDLKERLPVHELYIPFGFRQVNADPRAGIQINRRTIGECDGAPFPDLCRVSGIAGKAHTRREDSLRPTPARPLPPALTTRESRTAPATSKVKEHRACALSLGSPLGAVKDDVARACMAVKRAAWSFVRESSRRGMCLPAIPLTRQEIGERRSLTLTDWFDD